MPLLLLIYPFVEFWSLLEFSAQVGALATISYIVLMMVLGYWLLKLAGRSALLAAGRFPSAAALRGQIFAGEISVAFGAILLMIPGLVSDVLALYVFLRAALRSLLGLASSPEQRRSPAPERDIPSPTNDRQHAHDPVTLEGDFSRVDDD